MSPVCGRLSCADGDVASTASVLTAVLAVGPAWLRQRHTVPRQSNIMFRSSWSLGARAAVRARSAVPYVRALSTSAAAAAPRGATHVALTGGFALASALALWTTASSEAPPPPKAAADESSGAAKKAERESSPLPPARSY